MDLMATQKIIVPDLPLESSDEEDENEEPNTKEKPKMTASEDVTISEEVKETEIESPVSFCECGKFFKTLNACYTHIENYHVKVPEKVDAVYNCDSCGELFDTFSAENNHRKKMHEEGEKVDAAYNCDICGELFNTADDGNNHMIVAHHVQTVENIEVKKTEKAKVTKAYSCDNCTEKFIYSADHIVHQVEVHGVPGVSDSMKPKRKVQPYVVKLAEQNIILAEEINDLKEVVEKQNSRMSTMFDIVRNLKTYEEFKMKVTTQGRETETAVKPKKTKNTKPETTTKPALSKETKPAVVVQAHIPMSSSIRIECCVCKIVFDSTEAMTSHRRSIHGQINQPTNSVENKQEKKQTKENGDKDCG